MSTGNRYGIQLDNIYRTAEVVKTAREARRGRRISNDTREATVEGLADAYGVGDTGNAALKLTSDPVSGDKEAVAVKGDGTGNAAVMKATTDTIPETGEAKSSYYKNLKAVTRRNALQKMREEEAQRQARINGYMNAGYSKNEAKLKANLDIREVKQFESLYDKMDARQKQATQQGLVQAGNKIYSILEVAKQDPQQAEKMYQDNRVKTLERAEELRANGRTKEADRLKKEYDSMPPSLIKNGQFDPTYLNSKLSIASSMLRTAKDYAKDRDTERKIAVVDAKEKAKGKSGKGFALKSTDENYINKMIWRELGGIDIGTDSDKAVDMMADFSAEKRNAINKVVAEATRLYVDADGKITRSEAVKQAIENYNSKNKTKQSSGGKVKYFKDKNGKIIKVEA